VSERRDPAPPDWEDATQCDPSSDPKDEQTLNGAPAFESVTMTSGLIPFEANGGWAEGSATLLGPGDVDTTGQTMRPAPHELAQQLLGPSFGDADDDQTAREVNKADDPTSPHPIARAVTPDVLEYKDNTGPNEFADGTELDLRLWGVDPPPGPLDLGVAGITESSPEKTARERAPELAAPAPMFPPGAPPKGPVPKIIVGRPTDPTNPPEPVHSPWSADRFKVLPRDPGSAPARDPTRRMRPAHSISELPMGEVAAEPEAPQKDSSHALRIAIVVGLAVFGLLLGFGMVLLFELRIR
jgi:hypothetical protein